MNFQIRALALLVFCLFGGPLRVGSAVTPGQIDTFETGTTLSWANGGVVPQPILSTGGPDGIGDHFLDITANGSGAGGKLTVFNHAQWLGDYIGQAISGISMDLENLGATTLTIRIAFKQTTSGSSPGYLSEGFDLPADASWHRAVFSITPESLTAIGGPSSFSAFFTNGEAELRIINEVGATNLNGDPIASHLGVDNIQAVPELDATALALSAACGAFLIRRLRRNARESSGVA
ncbi:MAG: hypothetical protein PHC88_03105 [Terrimicrobiaceae bacterium]|nr:hypothetical protein [Terrimicrobiaceae bacterium]